MNRKSDYIIYDRLYGQLDISHNEWQLFQTPELARLRHVSLSAVPTWALPTGTCASKFEHTVGVTHLAKIIGHKPQFTDEAINIYLAALLHDIGTPPFSHISEKFQVAILGKNHEEFVENIIDGSELVNLINKQGGSVTTILKLINGALRPLSDLINGSIDIDNLDNSLRWGLSMGILNSMPYSPEKIAASYTKMDNQIGFTKNIEPELVLWEQTRRFIYDIVYSNMNYSPDAMLTRALYFAAKSEKLTKNYFLLSDEAAFIYLSEKGDKQTQDLIYALSLWNFYLPCFQFTTTHPTTQLTSLAKDVLAVEKLTDELCNSLHIPTTHLCILIVKDRTHKNIQLPLVDNESGLSNYPTLSEPYWRIDAFIHPSLVNKISHIKQSIMDQFVNLSIY